MKKIILISQFFCLSSLFSQPSIKSLAEIRNIAIANSPSMKAADAAIIKNRVAEKSSIIFDNPALKVESPTGTFYTLGIEQNFSLPTVYRNQKKLSAKYTEQAETDLLVNRAEVVYNVSLLYLEAQHQQALSIVLSDKKTVLDSLNRNTKKTYEAGEIDYLSVKDADVASDIGNLDFLTVSNDSKTSYEKLKYYLNIGDQFSVSELNKYEDLLLSLTGDNNTVFDRQSTITQEIAQQELDLAKLQSLPGFSLGYMNQGEKNSSLKYRFGLGMTLPIWFKQNKAIQSTAKANVDYVAENNKALSLDRKLQTSILKTKIEGLTQKIDYISQKGLKNIEELQSISLRMLNAGENNLLTHLNHTLKIYDMKLQLINNVKEYNMMILELEYLSTK